MVLLVVISAAVLSGCAYKGDKNIIDKKIIDNGSGIKISEPTQELKKFSSVQEIREFLDSNAQGVRNVVGYGTAVGAMPMPVPASAPLVVGTSAPLSKGASEISAPSAGDYSKTNIQVEGVDEADFVKNDGKYIYVLSQDKLVIVDAFPADNAKILSAVMVEGRPKDMFVNGDRLIVFTENDTQVMIYPEYGYRPEPRYTTRTDALIYDITDRKKPEQVANYSINGNYFRSRMIGDYVYFIVKDYVYYYNDMIDVPAIRQGSVKIMTPDVYYFDNPGENYMFHTIASININPIKTSMQSPL